MMNRNEKLDDAKAYNSVPDEEEEEAEEGKGERWEGKSGRNERGRGVSHSDFSGGGILKPVWTLWNLEK